MHYFYIKPRFLCIFDRFYIIKKTLLWKIFKSRSKRLIIRDYKRCSKIHLRKKWYSVPAFSRCPTPLKHWFCVTVRYGVIVMIVDKTSLLFNLRVAHLWFAQVVAGSSVSPSHGGLCESGHTDTVGAQPPVLRAGEKMQSGWNRVPIVGHCVHNKHADHRA